MVKYYSRQNMMITFTNIYYKNICFTVKMLFR